MRTPVDQAKDVLELVADNPEALLYLISGAIDRLNAMEEGTIGKAFKETWYSQSISQAIN